MATQTKEKNIQTLLSKPVNELTRNEQKLIQVALIFGDFYDLEHRDLNGTATTESLDTFIQMLQVCEQYNNFYSAKVVKVLEKHRDVLENKIHRISFGRKGSPSIEIETGYWNQPELDAFWRDMVKSTKPDEAYGYAYDGTKYGTKFRKSLDAEKVRRLTFWWD
jgi:hypothetical protein